MLEMDSGKESSRAVGPASQLQQSLLQWTHCAGHVQEPCRDCSEAAQHPAGNWLVQLLDCMVLCRVEQNFPCRGPIPRPANPQ